MRAQNIGLSELVNIFFLEQINPNDSFTTDLCPGSMSQGPFMSSWYVLPSVEL